MLNNSTQTIIETAQFCMNALQSLLMVKGCEQYGSVASGSYDEFSDIDILVDVSGYDNSVFMLEAPNLLQDKLPIVFYDFAPSLIPNSYIVSLAISEDNPFWIVDLKCIASPFCQTVTRQQAKIEPIPHTLKVWVANLKHHLRGADCYNDIMKMASRLQFTDVSEKTEARLLEETLRWLEHNQTDALAGYIRSCRAAFDNLI
jgi:predicted nucleotidyltransferase